MAQLLALQQIEAKRDDIPVICFSVWGSTSRTSSAL